MRRLITIFLSSFSILLVSAQTQHGYVKTKGRLDAKGKLIPGIDDSHQDTDEKQQDNDLDGVVKEKVYGQSYRTGGI